MRVVAHIGYPRTGTTLLQKNIFPLHKQINFLGPQNVNNPKDNKIDNNDLNFISININENDLENRIINEKDLNLIKYFEEDKINIISSEAYTMFQNTFYNFRDLRYLQLLINKKYENVKFDFLIVLRSQYDLIKSIYHFNYHKISEILRMKDFKLIFDTLDGEMPDKYIFPLNQFLYNYDFFQLHNNLLSKFKNSNIKYLFYEDLNNDKNYFINEFCNFLHLEQSYTKTLFNTSPVNSRKVELGKNFYIKSKTYDFLKSENYLKIKNMIPFKNLIKKYFINNFVFSNFQYSIQEEKIFKSKIKEYYKNSNFKFFEQIKINNKYNY